MKIKVSPNSSKEDLNFKSIKANFKKKDKDNLSSKDKEELLILIAKELGYLE